MSEEGGFSDFISSVTESFSAAADVANSIVDNVTMALFGDNKASEGLMIPQPVVYGVQDQSTHNNSTTSVNSYFAEPYRSY